MVPAWLLEALAFYKAFYKANTGDMRYREPRSPSFEVDENHVYKHDTHTLSKTIVDQWEAIPYTLFTCEPNCIYSPCNLQDWIGHVAYDRVFGTKHTQRLSARFEDSLLSEFDEPDEPILPIRSDLNGFTIFCLLSALSDLSNVMFCRGYTNYIARRMWAIFRHENIIIDKKTGTLGLVGLVEAELIGPGTYKGSSDAIYIMVAHTAVSLVMKKFYSSRLRS